MFNEKYSECNTSIENVNVKNDNVNSSELQKWQHQIDLIKWRAEQLEKKHQNNFR